MEHTIISCNCKVSESALPKVKGIRLKILSPKLFTLKSHQVTVLPNEAERIVEIEALTRVVARYHW